MNDDGQFRLVCRLPSWLSKSSVLLKRQQEADARGLLVPGELAKCPRGGGGFTLMSEDRVRDVGGAAIVQESAAHAQAPQRRRAPILAGRFALHDAVVHGRPQIVQEQV